MKPQKGEELFQRFWRVARALLGPGPEKSDAQRVDAELILHRMGLLPTTLRTLLVLAELKGVGKDQLPRMVWRVAKFYRVRPQEAALHLLQGDGWDLTPHEQWNGRESRAPWR